MSEHPTDRLIRDLIQNRRPASDNEVAQIVDRIARAHFSRQIRVVPSRDRGASYGGRTLGNRADSLTYHIVKRVVVEEQWADGTTDRQYVADLWRAARSPAASLAVYVSGDDHIAVTLTPTADVIPPERLGIRPEQLVLVVYSAGNGIIVTGYQVSSVSATRIPSEAIWLR